MSDTLQSDERAELAELASDTAPEGYNARIDWNERRAKAGHKQVTCGSCGLWCWPCELSGKTITHVYSRSEFGTAKIEVVSQVCKKCDAGKAEK